MSVVMISKSHYIRTETLPIVKPRYCKYCGIELRNNRCYCANSRNEYPQFDEYTGIHLEDD